MSRGALVHLGSFAFKGIAGISVRAGSGLVLRFAARRAARLDPVEALRSESTAFIGCRVDSHGPVSRPLNRRSVY